MAQRKRQVSDKKKASSARRPGAAGRGAERPAPDKSPARRSHKGFPIVGIGASAGGLTAFTELLQALPDTPEMAFVILSHLDPQHSSILDTLLMKQTKMPVHVATHGVAVEQGHVYVVPPNKTVTLSKGVLRTRAREAVRGHPAVIDDFLASLAQDQRANARGVVLSGIGSDGTEGLKQIRMEGGVTFAQDPRTAQFDKMPASAIAAGVVDFVLSPAQIANRLVGLIHMPAEAAVAEKEAEAPDAAYGDILAVLLKETGMDFREYRSTTLRRRIARRMALKHFQTLASYARHVQQNADEARNLYADFLIHVSGFFRDTDAFHALEQHVIRSITSRRTTEPIRVWVPGCSSGEEVYSIGMLLLENLGARAAHRRIQLFGTDISASEIDAARAGRYAPQVVAQVGPRRLKRFFTEVSGWYQVNRELRDLCVFACQDVGNDPPFSKLDLISCRNILMYFTRPLQARVVRTFHYVLKPGGHLFMGRSESVASQANLFAVVDRKHRIYKRREVITSAPPRHEVRPGTTLAARMAPQPPPGPGRGPGLGLELDRTLLDRYAPPGLFVDEELQILAFHGDMGEYVKPVAGQANLHLSRMVPPAVALDIRTAIREARKTRRAASRAATLTFGDGERRAVNLVVIPVPQKGERGPGYLVLFERRTHAAELPVPAKARDRNQVTQIKRELQAAHEQLQTVIEEKDQTEQELRTAHEEVLSSNEELQSSNEELETGKEELQSANEELTTVNEEVQKRNEELDRLTGELTGLIAGIDIPIVNLDHRLRVLRFNPSAGAVFNLIPSDVGRSFEHIRLPMAVPEFDTMLASVLQKGTVAEHEVQDRAGRWHSLRVRPHRSTGGRVGGLLITLVDIDATKRRAAAVVETIREPLLVLDSKLRVLSTNPAFLALFRMTARDVEGRQLFELGHGQWDFPELRKLLSNQRRFEGLRLDHVFPGIGRKVLLVNGQQVYEEGRETPTTLLVFMDMTELEATAGELRGLTARLRESQEQQDRRVSRELHDLASEGLAGLALDLARVEKQLPAKDRTAAGGLKALRKRVEHLAESMHQLSRFLHPSVLSDLGLGRALHAELDAFKKRQGIAVVARFSRIPRKLPDEVSLLVYRVLQESLRNVARHAKAHRVTVAVRVADGALALSIRDDGVGFDPARVRGKGRLGLLGMKDRVQAAAGSLDIVSAPTMGTTVKAVIPLTSAS